jgi:hypothetical protein
MVEYCGIRISETSIAEMDGQQPTVVVQRPDILRVAIFRGWQAQRPLILFVFGAALLAVGLIPIPGIIDWLLFGGILSTAWVWVSTMILFGGYILYDASRRGYFLAIDGLNRHHKLCFSRRAKRSELQSFLRQAEERFGYRFEWSIE